MMLLFRYGAMLPLFADFSDAAFAYRLPVRIQIKCRYAPTCLFVQPCAFFFSDMLRERCLAACRQFVATMLDVCYYCHAYDARYARKSCRA